MGKVRIVTDSTSDLPPELARQYGITVVPLRVHFGPEEYLDGVEMTSQQFFEKLKSSPYHPKTSQPSPADFEAAYRRLLEESADPIVSIHISHKLSGTIQSAEMAKMALGNPDISLFDTMSASMGIGVHVLEAARAAQAGKSREEILALLERRRGNMQVIFAVDTLEFLYKNGRIGKAQVWLGTAMNIKPILKLEDGEVVPHERLRGQNRVIPRLVELVREAVPAGATAHAVVVHGDVLARAENLAAELRAGLGIADIGVFILGSVIGTNVGPGTMGVVTWW